MFVPHLFWVSEVQFGSQIDNLQLDNVFLVIESFGHLSQDVGGDFGDVFAVFSDQPQDARSGHGHLTRTHTQSGLESVWDVKTGSLDLNSTWMLSMSLAICLMMSLCCSGCIWRSFLITTTDSATTNSENTHKQTIHTEYYSTLFDRRLWLLHCTLLFFTACDRPISSAFQEHLQ